ncbi:MAG: hypothetical protein AB8G18_03330 [Gammaproteobacteria bacterium]
MRIIVGLLVAIIAGWLVWSKLSVDPVEVVGLPETPEEVPVVASAPPPEEEVSPAPVEEEIVDDNTGPRRIEVEDPSDFFGLMAEIGLDDMEQRFADWSLDHGYPFSDQTGVLLLEQPYDQYDDETLRAFADGEDMWAQQFLAKRLEKTRPAEAIDWYRKAAINGSLYAMDQLTALYGKLERARADGPNTDAVYKEQLLAVRDSAGSSQEMGFAWSMASVMAGGDPGRSRLTLDALGRNFDDEQQQRACDMATSLYSDISSERQGRGMADFSRKPPPLMMGTLGDASSLPCGGGGAAGVPHVDTSSCEELVMVLGASENEIVVCRN